MSPQGRIGHWCESPSVPGHWPAVGVARGAPRGRAGRGKGMQPLAGGHRAPRCKGRWVCEQSIVTETQGLRVFLASSPLTSVPGPSAPGDPVTGLLNHQQLFQPVSVAL